MKSTQKSPQPSVPLSRQMIHSLSSVVCFFPYSLILIVRFTSGQTLWPNNNRTDCNQCNWMSNSSRKTVECRFDHKMVSNYFERFHRSFRPFSSTTSSTFSSHSTQTWARRSSADGQTVRASANWAGRHPNGAARSRHLLRFEFHCGNRFGRRSAKASAAHGRNRCF